MGTAVGGSRQAGLWGEKCIMNQVLESILASRAVSDGTAMFPLHSHISDEEGKFIHEVVAAVQPVRLVEVGMENPYTGCHQSCTSSIAKASAIWPSCPAC